jgi:hypothetical protein
MSIYDISCITMNITAHNKPIRSADPAREDFMVVTLGDLMNFIKESGGGPGLSEAVFAFRIEPRL